MRLSFKKLFLLLVIIILLFSLANCKKSSKGKTVTVWTLWPESVQDTNAIAFHEALESAKTDMPDIIIEHDGTENEAYKTKIKTAMAADEVPDVFFAWGAGFVKPFVEADKVLALDDYIAKDGVLDKMEGGANGFFTFNGKIYGLTGYGWVASLYCNKELFDKAGAKIPDTYDEFKDAIVKLKKAGIVPISVGEKDRWPGMFWQNAFAIRTAGAAECNKALAGEASFDTPDFVKSAALLKELVDMGAFADGVLGLSYDEANAFFLQGKAAMSYMGNWFAGDIMGTNSTVSDKIIAKKFPVLSDGKGGATEFLGGAIDGLCVSKSAKNKEASVKVAAYLMQHIAMNLQKKGEGIPTWKVSDIKSEKINPVVEQIKELVKGSTGWVLAWDTFLSGADADDHKNLIAEIFGGKLSPEDFAKKMQAMNEKK